MKTIQTALQEQIDRANQYAMEQLAERERVLKAEQEKNRARIRIAGLVQYAHDNQYVNK